MSALVRYAVAFCATIFLIGCAAPSRMGMVTDARSGLQFGSMIEKNLFMDASQFKNRSIKVTTRNASGDQAYQVAAFTSDLNSALSRKGYQPTSADSFGIKLDLNVLYSGHVQQNMQSQFAFLGGAAGGITGYRYNATAGAAGVLVGATLGSIIGSYVTDDTYVIIAEVSLGVTDSIGGATVDTKTITFGSSPKLQDEVPSNFKPFREVLRTKVAVYAGGRNVSQQQIAEQVKQRLISIVSDSI
jgi:Enterobacterial TraT complement resistance protein